MFPRVYLPSQVVFKLEVAKSGADQALAELIGIENQRKLELNRQRAPTPGGALVAEAGSGAGFWNNLNLWPGNCHPFIYPTAPSSLLEPYLPTLCQAPLPSTFIIYYTSGSIYPLL